MLSESYVSRDSLLTATTRRAWAPTTPAANGLSPHLADEADRREKRAKRFTQPGAAAGAGSGSLAARLGARGRLVQGGVHSYGNAWSGTSTPEPEAAYDPVRASLAVLRVIADLTGLQNVIDWDQHTIVGRSTKLEKPYLRLTTVRLRLSFIWRCSLTHASSARSFPTRTRSDHSMFSSRRSTSSSASGEKRTIIITSAISSSRCGKI